jgi:hypothetical protein
MRFSSECSQESLYHMPRKCDLQLNGYPRGFIDSVINTKGSSLPKKEVKSLGCVYPLCKVRFGEIQVHSGIRPEGDMQQTEQCVFSIPCACGRSYIGETG